MIQLHDVAQSNDSDEYPLLSNHFNNDTFWADVCEDRYEIRPFDVTRAKIFFQAEYLYGQRKYNRAAEMGSFRGLHYLVNRHAAANNFQIALDNAVKAAEIYGAVGRILCLQVLEIAVKKTTDPTLKTDFITSACEHLYWLENHYLEVHSQHYLVALKWNETIDQNYGSMQGFIQKGRDYFEPEQTVGMVCN